MITALVPLIAIVSGLAFGAGCSAFLITYAEASHRFRGRRAVHEGLHGGVTAFAFFEVIGLVMLFVLFHFKVLS